MRGTGVRLAAAHGGGGVGRVEYKRKKLSSLVTLAHRYNVSDDVKKQPWYIPTSAGDPETRREPPPPPLLPGEAANQEPSETGQQTEHERPSTTSHAAATFQQTLDALVLCRGPAPQRRRQRGASPPPSRSDQASVFPDDHRQTPQTEPTRGGEASGRVCSTHLRGEEGERRRSEAALLTTAGQVETADSSGASKQARTTMAPRARGEASERVRSTQLRGEESERKRTEAAQTAAGPPVETSDSPRAPQPAPRGRKPLSLPDRWYPELPEADGADDDDGGLPARGGRRCGPPGAAAGCPAATYTPTAARTFGSTLGTSRADGGALPQPQGAQCATAQHGTRHGAEEPAADASIRSTLQPGRVDGGVLPHPHGAHCAPARDGSEPAADAGTRSTPQTDRTRAAAHPSPLPAPATGRRGTPAWPPVSEPGHATAGPHRHQPRLDIPDPDTNFHRLKVGARDWEDNAFRKKSSISLPFESELAGGERGADGDQGTWPSSATLPFDPRATPDAPTAAASQLPERVGVEIGGEVDQGRGPSSATLPFDPRATPDASTRAAEWRHLPEHVGIEMSDEVDRGRWPSSATLPFDPRGASMGVSDKANNTWVADTSDEVEEGGYPSGADGLNERSRPSSSTLPYDPRHIMAPNEPPTDGPNQSLVGSSGEVDDGEQGRWPTSSTLPYDPRHTMPGGPNQSLVGSSGEVEPSSTLPYDPRHGSSGEVDDGEQGRWPTSSTLPYDPRHKTTPSEPLPPTDGGEIVDAAQQGRWPTSSTLPYDPRGKAAGIPGPSDKYPVPGLDETSARGSAGEVDRWESKFPSPEAASGVGHQELAITELPSQHSPFDQQPSGHPVFRETIADPHALGGRPSSVTLPLGLDSDQNNDAPDLRDTVEQHGRWPSSSTLPFDPRSQEGQQPVSRTVSDTHQSGPADPSSSFELEPDRTTGAPDAQDTAAPHGRWPSSATLPFDPRGQAEQLPGSRTSDAETNAGPGLVDPSSPFELEYQTNCAYDAEDTVEPHGRWPSSATLPFDPRGQEGRLPGSRTVQTNAGPDLVDTSSSFELEYQTNCAHDAEDTVEPHGRWPTLPFDPRSQASEHHAATDEPIAGGRLGPAQPSSTTLPFDPRGRPTKQSTSEVPNSQSVQTADDPMAPNQDLSFGYRLGCLDLSDDIIAGIHADDRLGFGQPSGDPKSDLTAEHQGRWPSSATLPFDPRNQASGQSVFSDDTRAHAGDTPGAGQPSSDPESDHTAEQKGRWPSSTTLPFDPRGLTSAHPAQHASMGVRPKGLTITSLPSSCPSTTLPFDPRGRTFEQKIDFEYRQAPSVNDTTDTHGEVESQRGASSATLPFGPRARVSEHKADFGYREPADMNTANTHDFVGEVDNQRSASSATLPFDPRDRVSEQSDFGYREQTSTNDDFVGEVDNQRGASSATLPFDPRARVSEHKPDFGYREPATTYDTAVTQGEVDRQGGASSATLPFDPRARASELKPDFRYREPATTNDTEVAHAARGAPLSSASYDPDGSWPASSVVATAPRRADGEGKPSRPTDEEDSELEANSDLEPPAKESRVPKGDEEHRLRTTDVSTRVVDVGEMDRPLSASYDPDGSWPASSVVATAQRLRTGGPSAADGEGRPIGEEDGGLEADRDLEPWAQESRASTGDEEHRLRTTDVSTRMVDVGEMNRLLNARGAPHPLTVFEKLTARGFVVSDAALARLIARVGKELLTWGTKPGNDDQAKRSALGKQVLSKLEDLSESHEAGPLSADALLLCCCCVPLPHTAGKVYARFVSEKVALSRGTLITYVKMLDAFDFGREAKTALLEAVRMGIDVPADLVQKITNPPNVHSARTMRGVAKKHKRAEPPQVLC